MTDRTTPRTTTDRTTRRTYLVRSGVAGLATLAGCLGDDGGDGDGEDGDDANGDDEDGADGTDDLDGADLPAFPEIENPPDAVYLPTHRESMRHVDPVRAGDYALAPMLSYPHLFWIVAGEEVQREDPEDGTGVHLMFTLRDEETGVVLPVESGAEVRVLKDGEQVGSPRIPWPMLSQEMGFHFGDNVPLEEDGTHTVEITLPPPPPPPSVQLTGDLDGRFEETATATFEFEYDDEFRETVVGGVEYLDEAKWGEPGALEPMGGGASEPGLPSAESYPGTHLDPADPADDGLAESGDARFVVTLLEAGSQFVDGDGRYLLVSPRTPYNRVPIPELALAATVDRDGETIAADESLVQTIDGEYGLHYGTPFADIEPGDVVTIESKSIPQVARHRGYETAFVEMPPIELTVPRG